MKAMIFAAGLGTRLQPFTLTAPKALFPLCGKTLLQYQIDKLRAAGINDIVINVHHFARQIVDYLHQHDNFGCHIAISDETDCLLDTGGGLRHAAKLLQDTDNPDEPVLACNVDILSNIDLSRLISAHQADSLATLVVSERQTQRYLLFDNSLTLRGWTNIATGERRPDTLSEQQLQQCQRLAFSGMQLLSPHILTLFDDIVAQKGERFSVIDLYLSLCKMQPIRAYIPDNYSMIDVGKTNDIYKAEEFVKNHSSY